MIVVSPNPAKDNLFVTIDEESPEVKSLSQEENISMALYDFNTNILVKKYDFKTNQKKFSLPLTGLPAGKYVLVVKKGTQYKTTQVIVQ